MKLAIVVAVFLGACTTLGPMPATTGISAVPLGRPGAQAQLGSMPGFYASQAAKNEAKGAPIQHLSALFDPDRWLPVKAIVIGARVFGQDGDTPGEPYVGYRSKVNDRVAVGAVAFGSSKRSESRLASYHGVRAGAEGAVDAELWAPSHWFSVHAQAAASITRILASGTYCVDVEGIAKDCDEMDPSTNVMASGKTTGVYPAATGTLALELGSRSGLFDSARLALLGGMGRMPLVEGGTENGTGTYYTLGASLTLGVAFADGAQ
jgi:hypothetical protein